MDAGAYVGWVSHHPPLVDATVPVVAVACAPDGAGAVALLAHSTALAAPADRGDLDAGFALLLLSA